MEIELEEGKFLQILILKKIEKNYQKMFLIFSEFIYNFEILFQ